MFDRLLFRANMAMPFRKNLGRLVPRCPESKEAQVLRGPLALDIHPLTAAISPKKVLDYSSIAPANRTIDPA